MRIVVLRERHAAILADGEEVAWDVVVTGDNEKILVGSTSSGKLVFGDKELLTYRHTNPDDQGFKEQGFAATAAPTTGMPRVGSCWHPAAVQC